MSFFYFSTVKGGNLRYWHRDNQLTSAKRISEKEWRKHLSGKNHSSKTPNRWVITSSHNDGGHTFNYYRMDKKGQKGLRITPISFFNEHNQPNESESTFQHTIRLIFMHSKICNEVKIGKMIPPLSIPGVKLVSLHIPLQPRKVEQYKLPMMTSNTLECFTEDQLIQAQKQEKKRKRELRDKEGGESKDKKSDDDEDSGINNTFMACISGKCNYVLTSMEPGEQAFRERCQLEEILADIRPMLHSKWQCGGPYPRSYFLHFRVPGGDLYNFEKFTDKPKLARKIVDLVSKVTGKQCSLGHITKETILYSGNPTGDYELKLGDLSHARYHGANGIKPVSTLKLQLDDSSSSNNSITSAVHNDFVAMENLIRQIDPAFSYPIASAPEFTPPAYHTASAPPADDNYPIYRYNM